MSGRNVGHDEQMVEEVSLHERMVMFDEFPYELREAYRYADRDYSIFQCYQAWKKGRHTVDYMVKAIKGEL